MATSSRSLGWQLGLAGFVAMGGANAAFGDDALAQIVPDATLGAESSVVTPNAGNVDEISGGATRGANLFHSFQQFSLLTGREAFFNNAASIQNIISRVTGGSISNIDGLLRAKGTANLFLLNPQGIIFGPNASLNIGGSFVASTASAVNFADGTKFSATAHPTTPLLSVSVPLGLQFGATAARIVNKSQAQSLSGDPNSAGGAVGLHVPDGYTLALVGGDVVLEGGNLTGKGGRIELGSVAGVGEVSLSQTGNSWILGYDKIGAFGDIRLEAGALVDVSGEGGGNVQIQGARLEMTQGARIFADTLGAQAGGGVLVHTTEAVTLSGDGSRITTDVSGSGTGGDLRIETGRLTIQGGARLASRTFSKGSAGTLAVTAWDSVQLAGTGDDSSSGLWAYVNSQAAGNSGGINITTGSLSVTNGAQLLTYTKGQGDAGSVTITASDQVSFDGVTSDRIPSGVFSSVNTEAVGNAGDINITTGSLTVSNGAQLSAETYGQGNAGSVTITATDTVSFDGVRVISGDRFVSGAFSQVRPGAVGNGGGIDITTGSLTVTNGAQLFAITSGRGDAGSVTITASDRVSFDGVTSDRIPSGALSLVDTEAVGNAGGINIATGSLFVTNGAQLNADTYGQGNAGSVTITARDTVSFDGVRVISDDIFPSGVVSQVRPGAVGNGGGIDITTRVFSVTNGAGLFAGTSGRGNAGRVRVTGTDTVAFDGVTSAGNVSGAYSTVGEQAVGNGGGIDITAGVLTVTNGAQLLANTFGQGDAGSVTITASDTVSFDGIRNGIPSGALSDVGSGAVGNGGGINITAGRLSVTNGAELTASSEGSGAAGNIEVAADSIRLDNQALLSSDTIAGQGSIYLHSRNLVLRRGSNITTNATGTATGGNININTDNLVALENSDISANAQQGFGGLVSVNAKGIFGTQFRSQPTPESDITATSELGPQFSGIVQINNPDVDPNQGLVELPQELVDASNRIASSCAAGGENKFTVTGRGGLPPNPREPLGGEAVLTNWATLRGTKEQGN